MVDPHKLAYAAHVRDAGDSIAEIVAKTGITRTTLVPVYVPPEPVTAAGSDRDTARLAAGDPSLDVFGG